MLAALPGEDGEKARIVLGLLESVERDGAQSQRRLASELGIALGLVNAYLKRCVKKGLLKVSAAPARRYVYYLTPQGFAEKSRLTVVYLAYSFSFFREARADCATVLDAARGRGWTRIVLVGKSDLAEVMRICALESGIEIVAIVDAQAASKSFVGLPVHSSFESVPACDGVIVTALEKAGESSSAAAEYFGTERVLAPKLLGLSSQMRQELAS